MYVMNKKWDSITNIAQCTSVYVSPEHEIKAVPTGGGNVYRLGQYETAEIARAVLNDLYMHISTGCVYQMPNDQRALVLARGMSDERPDKFAGNGKKSVRRGGSRWRKQGRGSRVLNAEPDFWHGENLLEVRRQGLSYCWGAVAELFAV